MGPLPVLHACRGWIIKALARVGVFARRAKKAAQKDGPETRGDRLRVSYPVHYVVDLREQGLANLGAQEMVEIVGVSPSLI
jgi:hypothetical protein